MYAIVEWEKWQNYRKDRGQPPWIKIHRRIMRNPKWVSLTDAERGQLVVMWLLAADHDGVIQTSDDMIQKLGFMTEMPNFNKFIELELLQPLDANMAPTRQPLACPKAETEAEAEAEKSSAAQRRQAVSTQRRKSGWPEGFILTDHRKQLAEAYWKKRGVSFDATVVWEKFESGSKAAGKIWADWDQAWVTWYSNQVDFARNGNGKTPSLAECLNRIPRNGHLVNCGKPGAHKVGQRPLCEECYAEYQERRLREV